MKGILKIVFSSLVIALFHIALAKADMFEDGFAAYKRGDFEIAARLWKPLAEQGDAAAQTKIGLLYEMGRGVPKDDSEAANWYHKAAEQGVAKAQVNLCYMFSVGQGVPQNKSIALMWCRKAAKQGDAIAQTWLGMRYASGDGVSKDNMLAYMWFYLAAKLNHEEARRNRNSIAPSLTRKQIVRAERMANDWMVEQNP